MEEGEVIGQGHILRTIGAIGGNPTGIMNRLSESRDALRELEATLVSVQYGAVKILDAAEVSKVKTGIWPSYGVLIFGALNASEAFSKVSRGVNTFSVLGLILTSAACLWFFLLSLNRKRHRPAIRRGLGYGLFLFGVPLVWGGVLSFGFRLLDRTQAPVGQTLGARLMDSPIVGLMGAAALFIGADYLVFMRPKELSDLQNLR